MTDDVLNACVNGCLECYEHRSVEVYQLSHSYQNLSKLYLKNLYILVHVY